MLGFAAAAGRDVTGSQRRREASNVRSWPADCGLLLSSQSALAWK
jgi:hypothetical protein